MPSDSYPTRDRESPPRLPPDHLSRRLLAIRGERNGLRDSSRQTVERRVRPHAASRLHIGAAPPTDGLAPPHTRTHTHTHTHAPTHMQGGLHGRLLSGTIAHVTFPGAAMCLIPSFHTVTRPGTHGPLACVRLHYRSSLMYGIIRPGGKLGFPQGRHHKGPWHVRLSPRLSAFYCRDLAVGCSSTPLLTFGA